ncbi:MAG: acyl-CoA dehydrogenase C-terminal domain-containing protein, partial [Casimicrobium sp.]
WSTGNPNEALANAVPYMQAFGHMVMAWVWLDVLLALREKRDSFAQGKLAACNYFFAYEVPKIEAWLAVVKSRDMTCANVSVEAL